jgi:hypothetical protein
MATILDVAPLALDLPERERAILAMDLLQSLPGVLSDDDEGIAESGRPPLRPRLAGYPSRI